MQDYKGLSIDDMIADAKRRQKLSSDKKSVQSNDDIAKREAELAAREQALREEQIRHQEELAKQVAENNIPPSVDKSEVSSSEPEPVPDSEQDDSAGNDDNKRDSSHDGSDMADLNESGAGENDSDDSGTDGPEPENVSESPPEPQEDVSDREQVSVPSETDGGLREPSTASGDDSKKVSKPLTIRSRPKNDVVTAKNIPRSVMNYVKSRFSDDEGRNCDFISAYVYVTSGKTIEVPPEVRELAESWAGEVPVGEVISEIDGLSRKLNRFDGKFREMELALMYIIMERLGFARTRPDSSGNINYMQNGFEEGISTLRTQANRFKQKEDIKNGVIKR